jgi:hypothetical protein
MRVEIEVWLRGNDFATTDVVDLPLGPPRGWSDGDVRTLLEALLRAVDRAKHEDADPDRFVAMRGFSWIVSPLDEGYTVAVEIQLGAAAAGPFDVDQAALEQMITRVMAQDRLPRRDAPSVH